MIAAYYEADRVTLYLGDAIVQMKEASAEVVQGRLI